MRSVSHIKSAIIKILKPYLTYVYSYLLAVGILFFIPFFSLKGAEKIDETIQADTIMKHVAERARHYSAYIDKYEATAYIKGTSRVVDKNFLFRFAPDLFALDKRNDLSVIESIVNIQFTAPNHFTQKITAVNGTTLNIMDVQKRAMQFFNLNVYNATSFNDEILMPMSNHAFKYYKFSYVSSLDTLGQELIKIQVRPKVRSQKLISGHIWVVKDLWTIASIDIRGAWDFSRFTVKTDFAMSNKEFLLPMHTELFLQMKLLGNHVENYYTSYFDYTSIERYKDESERKKIDYDLTDYFNVRLDSLPIIRDSLFWEEHRPVPLSESEKEIYIRKREEITLAMDSADYNQNKASWDLTKGILSPKNFRTEGGTAMKYSGLINPFKLGYSGSDGFVYWQQFKLDHIFESGRGVVFNPEAGYVFKRKELFFKIPLGFVYQPRKLGKIELVLGNRNRSYNSQITNIINEMLNDTNFNFDDLNIDYYKNYYLSLNNRFEIMNGFLLNTGIEYSYYKPVKSGETKVTDNDAIGSSMEEDINDLVNENYTSLTPKVGFTFTPKQYYRIRDKRKEYVWSDYPTFSIEYARAIPGVFRCDSDFERIEGDIQQRIPLGVLRSFHYYIGGGKFTKTSSLYFADFSNFAKRNFPESWGDQFGGVFYLLGREWYNASVSYMQFHMMYESPFILLQLFRGVAKDIFKERFYFGYLHTPVLPTYTELGYGVGNYIFNAGVFVSMDKWQLNKIGVRFTFELGK